MSQSFRFGQFELDAAAGELRRDGRRRRLQAQPLKLLGLLIRRAGAVVSYDDIRAELWADGTHVEFDQAVHYAVRQIREALGDSADQPLYVETVPRRGYRFIAPVEAFEPAFGPRVAVPATPIPSAPTPARTTVRLQKALWANIVELREAEARQKRTVWLLVGLVTVLAAALVAAIVFF